MSRVAIPEDYTYLDGTIHEQIDTPGNWSSGSADTSVFKHGTQSLKFDFSGTSSFAEIIPGTSYDFSNATTVGAWVYVGDRFEISDNVRVYLSMGTNPITDYFRTLITWNMCWGGWLFFGGDKAQFDIINSPDWSNIEIVRVYVLANNAEASGTIYIDSIVTDVITRPKLLISFDDGADAVYDTARAKAHTNNIKFTCYVNSDTIGNATKMTESNLVDLNSDGHEIANHSSAHDSYDSIGAQQAFDNFETGSTWLTARGYTGEHTAYVGGASDKDLVNLLEAGGYKTGRRATNNTYHDPLPVPQADFFNIKPRVLGVGNSTLAEAKTALDQALLTHSLCVFYGHIIKTGAATGQEWETSDWTSLCEYIALKVSQGLIDVVTISEWYDGLARLRQTVSSRIVPTSRIAASSRVAA